MKVQVFSLNAEKKRGAHEVELTRTIRLLVPAQAATIAPPLGPTLGQFGINIKDFCDKFNERSKIFENDIILNVFVSLFKNKNFDFEVALPSIAFMINEEEVEIENEYINKYLTLSSIFKIILTKEKHVALSQAAMFNCVLGTARSMEIKLVNNIKKHR